MAGAAADCTAFDEAIVFLSHFKKLEDPRQQAKVTYPLEEILLLRLLAVLGGAETITDIALFARSSTCCAAFAARQRHAGARLIWRHPRRAGPRAFQRCFVARVASLTGTPEGVIAIDGKTVRRSGQKRKGEAPIHMVSAFAARQRLVLGQIKVAEKSNEITAIPKLLELLAIEGAIVTIEAMGCQREIARKIVEKNADYVLALKSNLGTLREDVELFVAEQPARRFTHSKIHQTVDGDHGRIETRTTTVIHDVAWLRQRHHWPGLNAVVIVDSVRETADKVERERRFYITSLLLLANMLAPVVRSHWAIENGLHWVMDMVFRDDEWPAADRSCPGQLLHHQTHGAESDPPRTWKGFPATKAHGRRLG